MENFKFDKEDCRHYIGLLQENINRMAANSANCKVWLIGIITALIALEFTSDNMRFIILVAIIPLVLFYLLDSYYLGLEKRFIKLETDFIELLKSKKNFDKEIYVLSPQNLQNLQSPQNLQNPQKKGADCEYTWKGMKSWSTWPFYGVLLILLLAFYYIF